MHGFLIQAYPALPDAIVAVLGQGPTSVGEAVLEGKPGAFHFARSVPGVWKNGNPVETKEAVGPDDIILANDATYRLEIARSHQDAAAKHEAWRSIHEGISGLANLAWLQEYSKYRRCKCPTTLAYVKCREPKPQLEMAHRIGFRMARLGTMAARLEAARYLVLFEAAQEEVVKTLAQHFRPRTDSTVEIMWTAKDAFQSVLSDADVRELDADLARNGKTGHVPFEARDRTYQER